MEIFGSVVGFSQHSGVVGTGKSLFKNVHAIYEVAAESMAARMADNHLGRVKDATTETNGTTGTPADEAAPAGRFTSL